MRIFLMNRELCRRESVINMLSKNDDMSMKEKCHE
jgi:hypothetical protein